MARWDLDWDWDWDRDCDSEAEAQRALSFAEQRFLAGDVAGARDNAQRALSISPGLLGGEQALAAYDVHAAAAAGGGCCWYSVLRLPNPRTTTHDAVRRQHRRMCLLVHPDKNPSAAADGAFKLVRAAYEALKAIHPPPPPRDDDEFRFWQTAAQDDVAPPRPAAARKEPPIARPATRRAEKEEPPVARRWDRDAPPPGPQQQPPCRCRYPCACAFYRLYRRF